jgi:3-deoxy-D-manno-octulosonate 8-phosphate phosphatase (KDO 8-P phosphatase)
MTVEKDLLKSMKKFSNSKIDIDQIQIFIFDFDGVITNNLVYVDQEGKETVSCSRADGLAFDVLRKLNKTTYILSTEKNHVVSSRAAKLDVPVYQGVNDKVDALHDIAIKHKVSLENVLYIGNDLNDFNAMTLCGYSACPSDSHIKIKEISNIVLEKSGGNGVIRELLEDFLDLDLVNILYN